MNALVSFADAQTGLFGSADATLRSAVRTAQYELFWDSEHLTNIVSIVDKKVNGGAASPVASISLLVVACGLLTKALFIH